MDILWNVCTYFRNYFHIAVDTSLPRAGLEGEDLETPFQPKSLPNHHHETMTYDIKFHSLSLSQPQIMRKKMISSSGELFLLLFLSLFGCWAHTGLRQLQVPGSETFLWVKRGSPFAETTPGRASLMELLSCLPYSHFSLTVARILVLLLKATL